MCLIQPETGMEWHRRSGGLMRNNRIEAFARNSVAGRKAAVRNCDRPKIKLGLGIGTSNRMSLCTGISLFIFRD